MGWGWFWLGQRRLLIVWWWMGMTLSGLICRQEELKEIKE